MNPPMKWTYYSVTSKRDQYGQRYIRLCKTSRTKALANSTGCADAGGYRTGAYRATTASIVAMQAALDASSHWSGSATTVNGVEIECLS